MIGDNLPAARTFGLAAAAGKTIERTREPYDYEYDGRRTVRKTT